MKLSVIVPGYNNPKWRWLRCVDSLLAAKADEIICVDDGSQERPSFLDSYPVRVIYSKHNCGLAAARNAALEAATGDYVAFVDSDDEVVPDTFGKCKDELERTGADVVVYGVKCIWPEDGLAKVDVTKLSLNGVRPSSSDVLQLSRECLLNYSCNKVYRRAFLDKHNLRFVREGMPCEDIIFNLNCLMAGATYCTMSFVGYIYYRTRGTLLSKYKKTNDTGTRLASETWQRYKDMMPGSREILGSLGETSEAQLSATAWRNVWMPGTPFSLVQRWRMRPGSAFFKMAFFMVFRRYFYFRFIRRWNTRHNYPHVVDWHEE